MLFNSLAFLAFFPIVVLVYYLLRQKGQIYWLILASCFFYMWLIPNYLFILLFTIFIDYFAGILIEKSDSKMHKKFYLVFSLTATLLTLFFFKYFNFFQDSIGQVAAIIGWNYSQSTLSLLLPVGLSFHTFQSMSYVLEVYFERQKAERNFPVYFIYVMFFPQLVAGPIERPQNLLPQFHQWHQFNQEKFNSGLKMILAGLFLKVVIADRLSLLVNEVFRDPTRVPAPVLILSVIFFAFQIYCDFFGYSVIALGAAKILGFDLMENFKRPYLASSVTEFWRRWHISLSTWFRDYVYVPLGGSRKGDWRCQLNLMITFLLSGLWHGANWTFVVWGGLNGLFMVLENFLGLKTKIGDQVSFFRVLSTFLLVSVTWVFFRAQTTGEAIVFFQSIFQGSWIGTFDFLSKVPNGFLNTGLGVFLIFSLWMWEVVKEKWQLQFKQPWIYACLALLILFVGVFKQEQFIYFQF